MRKHDEENPEILEATRAGGEATHNTVSEIAEVEVNEQEVQAEPRRKGSVGPRVGGEKIEKRPWMS